MKKENFKPKEDKSKHDLMIRPKYLHLVWEGYGFPVGEKEQERKEDERIRKKRRRRKSRFGNLFRLFIKSMEAICLEL